jgi:hypothetical protein
MGGECRAKGPCRGSHIGKGPTGESTTSCRGLSGVVTETVKKYRVVTGGANMALGLHVKVTLAHTFHVANAQLVPGQVTGLTCVVQCHNA